MHLLLVNQYTVVHQDSLIHLAVDLKRALKDLILIASRKKGSFLPDLVHLVADSLPVLVYLLASSLLDLLRVCGDNPILGSSLLDGFLSLQGHTIRMKTLASALDIAVAISALSHLQMKDMFMAVVMTTTNMCHLFPFHASTLAVLGLATSKLFHLENPRQLTEMRRPR